MHDEFAAELKTRREASGLTLQDVFSRTRINLHFLEAIESGQFDILPDVYIRLFLRKYAQEIGLDPEDVTRRWETLTGPAAATTRRGRAFRGARKKEVVEPAAPTTPPEHDEPVDAQPSAAPGDAQSIDPTGASRPAGRSRRRSGNESRTPLIAGVAACILAVVVLYSMRSTTSEPETSSSSFGAPATASPPNPSGERVRAYSIQLPETEADSMSLAVSVSGRANLSLAADEELLFERAVSTGDNFSWNARRRFLLEVDRSEAVSINLQGKPLNLNAKPGSRLKLFISPASVWVEESGPGSAASF